MGETASREECIGACDEAGYEAMSWETIGGACYCHREGCCISEHDPDTPQWCGCREKDGGISEWMSPSECAARGCEYVFYNDWEAECDVGTCGKDEATCASAVGEWDCMAFGPMAFKGFPPPEVCDEEEDEDEEEDDNCTPGWQANECLNDGTVTYARGCSSCDDCEMYDLTAATGGRYTCEPGTNTYYVDEDLDGNVDVEGPFGECWYDDCDDDEGSDPTSVESPFLVTGDLTFEGMTYEAAQDNTDVFVAAVADLCGVAEDTVTVEISRARRRRRLAEGIVVTYTVGVATANEAQTVTSAISSSSTADVDAAISKAATDAGVDDDFDGVTTTNVGTPTTTASGDESSGGNGGNGGADAASAGIIGGAVAGVAVLAAIGVGAFLYMRSKASGADSPPLAEVQLVGSADESALPKAVASAPPIMPPPPPTGRNFCSNCGAPIQGSFCSQCGARA